MVSLIHTSSFADDVYKVQAGDFLGKIVSKKYPSSQRVNSREQIMIAILRANPEAFGGGNVHFLKKVDQLLLPPANIIALIPKDEALKTVKEHYKFFKRGKTGNFPLIPLQRLATEKVKEVFSVKKNKVIEENQKNKKVLIKDVSSGIKTSTDKKELEKKKEESPKKLEKKEKTSPEKLEGKEEESPKKLEKKEKTSPERLNGKEEESPKKLEKKEETSPKKLKGKEADSPRSHSENKKEDKKMDKTMSGDNLAYKNSSPHVEDSIKKTTKSKELKIKRTQKEKQIALYSWDNFVPKDVLTSFTQETGIKVNLSTYKTTKIMYEKIKALNGRGYDVLLTTGRLVQKMRDKGLLQVIDYRKLNNFKHLNPKLLNKPYDPNNEFSVPYIWGTTGIGIDTNKLKNKSITHWKDLWHKQWRNKLLLHNNMRDLFAVALKTNGLSINTKNPDEIKQAYNTLRKLIPNIKQLISKDRLFDTFMNNKGSIAMFWSSKAWQVKRKYPTFEYIYPEEGAIFWVDSFMIPSNASDIDSAHTFIDYLLRPDIAVRCANELGEATPNLDAMKDVINQNTITFPDEKVFEKGEFEGSLNETEELYQLYWKKFKQEVSKKLGWFVE